jgi:hypothetical protein
MSLRNAKNSARDTQNFRSAGWSGLKAAGRVSETAATGLFRWMTTDHSGMGRACANMLSVGALSGIGVLGAIRHVLVIFSYTMISLLIRTFFMVFTIVIWIPFLIWAIFSILFS